MIFSFFHGRSNDVVIGSYKATYFITILNLYACLRVAAKNFYHVHTLHVKQCASALNRRYRKSEMTEPTSFSLSRRHYYYIN